MLSRRLVGSVLIVTGHCRAFSLRPSFDHLRSYQHPFRRLSTMSSSSSQQQQPAKDITKWASDDGHFRRQASSFRDTIEKGGRFLPEKGRYFLYVSYACPWAHRTLIVRNLKGLDKLIDVAVVHPYMGPDGWSWPANIPDEFDPSFPDVVPDPLYGFDKLRQLYFKAEPKYEGRFTVPVLWDSKEETIVNNESSEIIRIFNHAFDEFVDKKHQALDFYPESLRTEIDELNGWVYDTINNGVYKAGFATKQAAYESAVVPLFESLSRVEKLLSSAPTDRDGAKHLIGGRLTEADIRLFTTVVRFDPVYVGHFKCNVGTVRANFPHLHRWLRELYWKQPAFKDSTNFAHIKTHYYQSHKQINPSRIVPEGPLPHILPLDA